MSKTCQKLIHLSSRMVSDLYSTTLASLFWWRFWEAFCPSTSPKTTCWEKLYCTFHKHANSKVQKLPSQLHFSLPSITITITSNEPWNTETHKTDRNPPITNHKPWPFEPVKVKFCFLRGPFRWLTAVKNAITSWLLNFRIRMFVKGAVMLEAKVSIRAKLQLYMIIFSVLSLQYYTGF